MHAVAWNRAYGSPLHGAELNALYQVFLEEDEHHDVGGPEERHQQRHDAEDG